MHPLFRSDVLFRFVIKFLLLAQLQHNAEAFARAFLGPVDACNLSGASASGDAAAAEGEGGHDAPPTGEVNAAEQ